jgi:hypothetical protein
MEFQSEDQNLISIIRTLYRLWVCYLPIDFFTEML